MWRQRLWRFGGGEGSALLLVSEEIPLLPITAVTSSQCDISKEFSAFTCLHMLSAHGFSIKLLPVLWWNCKAARPVAEVSRIGERIQEEGAQGAFRRTDCVCSHNREVLASVLGSRLRLSPGSLEHGISPNSNNGLCCDPCEIGRRDQHAHREALQCFHPHVEVEKAFPLVLSLGRERANTLIDSDSMRAALACVAKPRIAGLSRESICRRPGRTHASHVRNTSVV